MATTLSWSLTLQVSGSAAISVARPAIEVEAVDRVEVTVGAGQSRVVDLQPGAAAAIHVLLIKASSYGSTLSFKTNNGSQDSTKSVTLDAPQIYTGGSVALFDIEPRRLNITNLGDGDVTVEVLVARDATP